MRSDHIIGFNTVDLSEFGIEDTVDVPILNFDVMCPGTMVLRTYEIKTRFIIGTSYVLSHEAMGMEEFSISDRDRWVQNFLKEQGLPIKYSNFLYRKFTGTGHHTHNEIWSTDYTPEAYK